jgi:hypothetical protein
MNHKTETNEKSDQKITFLQAMFSVLQATFGVQSKTNRERDFNSGSVMPFVVAAIIFTIAFVLGLMVLVNFISS